MIRSIKSVIFHHKLKALYCIILSLLFGSSLIFYKALDPSLNVASSKAIENKLGKLGAVIADLQIQVLGLSSFIFAITLFSAGIIFYLRKKQSFLALKFLSSLLSAALFSVFLQTILKTLPSDRMLYGGFVGYLVSDYLSFIPQYYTIPLTFILSLTFLLLSLGFRIDDYKKAIIYLNYVITAIWNKLGHKIMAKLFGNIQNKKMRSLVKTPPFISKNQVLEEEIPIFANQMQGEAQNDFRNEYSSNSRKANIIDNSTDKFTLPTVDLFNDNAIEVTAQESRDQLGRNAMELLNVLSDFGVKGQVLGVSQGPVVTLYEFEPAAGTKSSRVVGLADDIARTLSALSTRISVIPGRNVLGIELPNKHRAIFYIKELIESKEYNNTTLNLPIILGKDLAGKPFIVDLTKMPHLLVAGTTGSGKSVAINAMILSLLYRHTPETCRFIMIDPKMLELSVYDGIPHLLTPVVTEPAKAIVALKWAVKEMEQRYRLMSNLGVRNIEGYNQKIKEAIKSGASITRTVQTGFDPETGKPTYETIELEKEVLPFIVVIVDEMADLMLVAGKEIESSIQRLAQMARAAGIHIVMATQRPSVDVITGVIKANFPSRISFKVTSKIDSRTILGEQGAEQLLGMGDMLYMGGTTKITRVHGPFVDDSEVERIAKYLKSQAVPEYISSVTESEDEEEGMMDGFSSSGSGDDDALYRQAVNIVRRDRKVSTSYIQRVLRIGYNRAAILVERMEKEGIVSEPNHSGKRNILIDEA